MKEDDKKRYVEEMKGLISKRIQSYNRAAQYLKQVSFLIEINLDSQIKREDRSQLMQNAAVKLESLLHRITSEGLTATKDRLFSEGALPPQLSPQILFGETDEQRIHGKNQIHSFLKASTLLNKY